MNEKVKSNKNILHILEIACFFYLPITFTINFLCHFMLNGKLLQAWANLIIFLITFVIALIVGFKSQFRIKDGIVRNTCSIYTILSFIINTFVFIIDDGKMWSVKSMILILSFAIIIALLLRYLKIKLYLIRTLIYYCVCLAAFMFLTVGIAEYTNGNNTMLLFGIFTIVYAIISIIYFYVKRSFLSFENDEKNYKRQFD
ncbi:MAG: hypothetical protein IJ039_00675 [Clostridia bacterium]|nr:hypothetical protein [Clostridia bacterium]